MSTTTSTPMLHTPLRTCVGCRETAARGRLLRVVRGVDGPAVDVRAVLPGRGAWVHAKDACITRAVKRGGLARGLKINVPSELGEQLIAAAGDVARLKDFN